MNSASVAYCLQHLAHNGVLTRVAAVIKPVPPFNVHTVFLASVVVWLGFTPEATEVKTFLVQGRLGPLGFFSHVGHSNPG